MPSNDCVAMLLAGGQGSRLRVLTKNLAKPAVPFGGQYRIIDFSLSNCTNSGIETVGVLTQYKPQLLNSYVGIGSAWDLSCHKGGTTILPPYVGDDGGHWYRGTAHAVYQNMEFIDQYNPAFVLILSGDHIYRMDYSLLLEYHQEKGAEITIAVIPVDWKEASRFGIMSVDEQGRITEFEEKPPQPKNNLASMGIYVFNREILKYYLEKDAADPESQNDFGKNVIPRMLREKRRMYAYAFQGYWRDVGTIESYWQASMDILQEKASLDLFDKKWAIYSSGQSHPPHYLASSAIVQTSLISEGCLIQGEVENCILFPGVMVGKGARIRDSVVMAKAKIESGVRVNRAIIGESASLGTGSIVGVDFEYQDYGTDGRGGEPAIAVVEENLQLAANSRLGVLVRMKRNECRLSGVAGV